MLLYESYLLRILLLCLTGIAILSYVQHAVHHGYYTMLSDVQHAVLYGTRGGL